MRVELSKNEKYLLLLTVLFVCVMGLLFWGERQQGEAGQYVVSTQRTAQEEVAPVAAYIDLNTATVQELTELPGVGEVIAGRILAWRAEHGPFTDVAQLLEVKGIGEAKLADIREAVTVGAEEPASAPPSGE